MTKSGRILVYSISGSMRMSPSLIGGYESCSSLARDAEMILDRCKETLCQRYSFLAAPGSQEEAVSSSCRFVPLIGEDSG